MMKRFIVYFYASLTVCLLAGCDYSNSDVVKVMDERDSLRYIISQQKEQLDEVTNLVVTINEVLDSIDQEEQSFIVNINNEGPNSRRSTIASLERYENMIRTQQKRIEELSIQLNHKEDDSHLHKFITHMKLELHKKDSTIKVLRRTIFHQKKVIKSKNEEIEQKNDTINSLNEQSERQKKALSIQDELINQCYIIIGTKKELINEGIINRKGKIAADNLLDKSKFTQVDIRKVRDISFEAKKPKILSNIPKSSYRLEHEERNYKLIILDVNTFWNNTNYLIIQTNSPWLF